MMHDDRLPATTAQNVHRERPSGEILQNVPSQRGYITPPKNSINTAQISPSTRQQQKVLDEKERKEQERTKRNGKSGAMRDEKGRLVC
jgi:hypothetical protein